MGRHPSRSRTFGRYGGRPTDDAGGTWIGTGTGGAGSGSSRCATRTLGAVEGLGDLGRIVVETVWRRVHEAGSVDTRPGVGRGCGAGRPRAIVADPQHVRASLKAGLSPDGLSEVIRRPRRRGVPAGDERDGDGEDDRGRRGGVSADHRDRGPASRRGPRRVRRARRGDHRGGRVPGRGPQGDLGDPPIARVTMRKGPMRP